MDLTQEELADKLCVSLKVVSRWETGTTYPPLELIPAMSVLFGVSADELIGVTKAEDGRAPKSVYGEIDSFLPNWHNPEKRKIISETLRIAHRDYPNDWGVHEWLILTTDDLEEKRKLAFELLEKCPDRVKRDEVIHKMITSVIRTRVFLTSNVPITRATEALAKARTISVRIHWRLWC